MPRQKKIPDFNSITFERGKNRRVRAKDCVAGDGIDNVERAETVHEALHVFAQHMFGPGANEDAETVLGDFLADTLHWCRMGGVDFEEALRRGRGHFACETTGKES